MNAFLSAASTGDTSTLQQEYLRCKCSLTSRTPTGQTALHLAVQHAHIAALKLLLSHPYNLCSSIPDNSGQTPLHLAAQGSSPEIVEILLDASGSPGAKEDCSLRDHSGKTAIFYAYANPKIEVLNRFLGKAPTCGGGCALTPEVVLRSSSSAMGGNGNGGGDYFSCKRSNNGDGDGIRRDSGVAVAVPVAVKACCSA